MGFVGFRRRWIARCGWWPGLRRIWQLRRFADVTGPVMQRFMPSGVGEHTTNDIAVFWPTGKPPVIVTAYITQCPGPESKRNSMLAQIGRLVMASAS
jgi:beta-lactamase class A